MTKTPYAIEQEDKSNAIQLIGKAIWPRCGFRASGIAGQRTISQAARPKPTSLPG